MAPIGNVNPGLMSTPNGCLIGKVPQKSIKSWHLGEYPQIFINHGLAQSGVDIIWLVVRNMFYFHFIYGMSSFPLTNSYFSRWLSHHQAVPVGHDFPWLFYTWQSRQSRLISRRGFERLDRNVRQSRAAHKAVSKDDPDAGRCCEKHQPSSYFIYVYIHM